MSSKVQLLLMSKQAKTKDGKKFRRFWTKVKILVKGEEEKGKQVKSLTVKFDEGVATKDFVRGIITCEEKDIDLPFVYQVKYDEETKKDRYPYIQVHKVEKYEERKPKSTIEFCLDDEEETEDVTIDGENLEEAED